MCVRRLIKCLLSKFKRNKKDDETKVVTYTDKHEYFNHPVSENWFNVGRHIQDPLSFDIEEYKQFKESHDWTIQKDLFQPLLDEVVSELPDSVVQSVDLSKIYFVELNYMSYYVAVILKAKTHTQPVRELYNRARIHTVIPTFKRDIKECIMFLYKESKND